MRARMAADLLFEALERRRPLRGLPAECRPRDLDEAYAIQAAFVDRRGRAVGYKIGYTNPAIQARFGVEHPISGRLTAGNVVPSGASLPAPAALVVAAEPEFAFRLRQPLPRDGAPFSRERVLASIDCVMPALEIVESRFEDWEKIGALLTVADNVLGSHLVLGPETPEFDCDELAEQEVVAFVDGVERTRGHGRNVLGNPIDSLRWLCDHLAARGVSLDAGAIVTTGCVCEVIEARRGMRIEARHGRFGSVELSFDG